MIKFLITRLFAKSYPVFAYYHTDDRMRCFVIDGVRYFEEVP